MTSYTQSWGLPTPDATDLIAGSTANLRRDIISLADKTDQSLSQVHSVAQTAQETAEDAAWQGITIRSDDLNNYLTSDKVGVYEVGSEVANGPVNQSGSLEVLPTSAGVIQRFTAWYQSGSPAQYERTTQGGTPTPWVAIRGGITTKAITADDDLDNYFDTSLAGYYRIASSLVGNLPVSSLGVLELIPMTNANIQRYTTWSSSGTAPRVFHRTRASATGAISEWHELTGQSSNITIDQGVRTSRGVIAADQALATFNARLMGHTTQPIPLVFAGSSTTAGNGATSPANRWVNQLTTFLQAKYPHGGTASTVQASGTGDFTPETGPGIHGYNIGRGGTQADDYLTDADTPAIVALDPALIVHMVGSNDYARRRSITTYKADLEHRIAHLSAAITVPHTHVLVQQFERQDRTDPNPLWTAYAEALREIAEDQPDLVAYINISEAFNTTGLDQDDPFGFFGPDNVHTNDAGHQYLAHLMAIGLGEK